ncbi:FMN-binding negative transcriptional regulator [Sphingobacterium paludis]|uniref:PaiB family negative transcriptional regulator n=1 Tax=Sphingobacterium paludis TaxID=1476465 RepID=A0A4V6PZW6_9SPHI|nr:FMN-binding negative transcriptional regulator [Sphingobacterium paludis]TDS10976.1 PaiB family negative transcriptional regulator [Sphingobacterium paludis]
MYIPKRFTIAEESTKIALMKRQSFACLVTHHSGRCMATHLPFVIEQDADKLYLVSHMAKANEQSTHLHEQPCMVIFTGPHAYISPQHYDKLESVPTWDYVAVHAYGKASLVTDPDKKMESLETMIQRYEPAYQEQWSTLSESFKSGMVKGLEAFRIEVTELQGQEKLSQNKSALEKERIIDSLSGSDRPEERALAEYMHEYKQRHDAKQDGAS